ncbi:MAG: DUF1415 domain-containing protein [Burkholderiaceae bacterium]
MFTEAPIDKQEILSTTKAWLEKAVIGLNLCPFAKAVHVKDQIRYAISEAQTPEALLSELIDELKLLNESDSAEVETTLLIHPHALTDFLDYNDFLEVADAALDDLDLVGIIQIASFHPQYQFAGTSADDIDNFTNRSPYPILHLLREASIERAVEAFPDASQIFDKNIETLRRIGHQGWDALNISNTVADSKNICAKNTTSKK